MGPLWATQTCTGVTVCMATDCLCFVGKLFHLSGLRRQFRLGVSTLWQLSKSCLPPIFVKKVIATFSCNTHSVSFCLQSLLPCNSRVVQFQQRPSDPPKTYTAGSFTKMCSGPGSDDFRLDGTEPEVLVPGRSAMSSGGWWPRLLEGCFLAGLAGLSHKLNSRPCTWSRPPPPPCSHVLSHSHHGALGPFCEGPQLARLSLACAGEAGRSRRGCLAWATSKGDWALTKRSCHSSFLREVASERVLLVSVPVLLSLTR